MRYARSYLALLVTCLLVCLLSPSLLVQTYAQNGLTLSPPLKEVTLGSGLIQANFDVTLKNSTGTNVNATYKLIDLKALSLYGGNTLDKAGLPDKYGLANWMTLPAGDTQTISANQTANINIHIDNRSDLSPWGHYGALVITTSPEGGPSSSISLNQQFISLIFVKKLGGEVYGLNLESFMPNSVSRIPDSVKLDFRSTGNVHVMPRGYIEVTDDKGKLISKGIINPESSLILPESSRQFITIMQPVSSASRGGNYTVTVYYRYDGQDEFSHRSITFTQPLVSTRLLVTVIAVFGITCIAILWLARRIKNNKKPAKNKTN